MIDVSVIIVNYNTSPLINDAIASIYEETQKVSFEIIVIDNNTEDLLQTIRFADRDEVKLIQMPENVGFGRANNAGLERAIGRNIFFLNPDTRLLNNAIDILSDYIDNHPLCGVCGGNLYDEDLKPATSFRRIFPSIFSMVTGTLFGPCFEKIITCGYPKFNPSDRIQNVAYICGADLMIRRNDLLKYGSFNPEFFMYYEEIELCHRFKQKGYKIQNVPQAKIQHLAGKAGCMGERKATMHYNSAQTYFKLTKSEKGYQIYRKMLGLIISLRLSIGKIFGKVDMITFWSTWNKLYHSGNKINK